MDADALAEKVARSMLAAEGTGSSWGITIDEVREDYARVSMMVRADMLNGHGFAHGGMIFALADSAFAYVCNGANHASMAAQAASIRITSFCRVLDSSILVSTTVFTPSRSCSIRSSRMTQWS